MLFFPLTYQTYFLKRVFKMEDTKLRVAEGFGEEKEQLWRTQDGELQIDRKLWCILLFLLFVPMYSLNLQISDFCLVGFMYVFDHIFDMFHYCQFIYIIYTQWWQRLLKIIDTDSPCEIKALTYGITHASLLTAGIYHIDHQRWKESLF